MMFHLTRFIGVGRVSQPAVQHVARKTTVSQGGHTSIKDKLAPE